MSIWVKQTLRSSHPDVFCKRSAIKNFAIFTGNTRARVPFLKKLHALCNFIKKRLWHRCFSVNFANILRTPFSIERFRWLLLHTMWKEFKYRVFYGLYFHVFSSNKGKKWTAKSYEFGCFSGCGNVVEWISIWVKLKVSILCTAL